MSTPKRETRLTNNILTAVRRRGIYARKIAGNPFQQAGLPDIIACAAGRFVGLEVKIETGQTTRIQDREIQNIRTAGGVAGVVRSVNEALAIVDQVLKGEL
jgi:Holliday junction resolvase